MVPIWKDYTVRVNETAVYFRIHLDNSNGTVLYEGRATAKPGNTYTDIRINDVCSNYMTHPMLDFSSAINRTRFSRTFAVTTASSPLGPWTTIASVEFQADWSYDYSYNLSRDGLQFPISLYADARQRLLAIRSSYALAVKLYYADGSVYNVNIPVLRSNDFNNDYNDDYSKTGPLIPGVAMVDLANYPGIVGVSFGGLKWNVEQGNCSRYALYYINAFGGWDALLCRGNGVESDSWDRKTYDTTYDNTVQQNRGTVDYINLQEKRWTLRTGWIPDGSRMHHLIGSTMVYLHDLQQDIILPVGVVTQETPYKTYKNEGAKLVNYEFEVALQQERMRR